MITDPQLSFITPNQQKLGHQRNQSDVSYQNQSRFPTISLRLLDEAIENEILPLNFKDKLIRNPNKYSIFFTKFDCDSPTLKKAMNNLKLTSQDLEIVPFYQYTKGSGNTLENVVHYLYYITQHYKILKELVQQRQIVKIDQRNQQQYQEFQLDGSNKKMHSRYQQSHDFTSNYSDDQNQSMLQKKSTLQSYRSMERLNMSIEEKLAYQKEKLEHQQYAYEKKMLNLKQTTECNEKKIEEKLKKHFDYQGKFEKLKNKEQQEKFKYDTSRCTNAIEKHNKLIENRQEKFLKKFLSSADNFEKSMKEKSLRQQKILEFIQEKQKREQEHFKKVHKNKSLHDQEQVNDIQRIQIELEMKSNQIEQFKRDQKDQLEKKSTELQNRLDYHQMKKMQIQNGTNSETVTKMCQKIGEKEMYFQQLEKEEEKKKKEKINDLNTRLTQTHHNKERVQEKVEKKIENIKEKLDKNLDKTNKLKNSQLTEKIHSLSTKNVGKYEKIQLQYAMELMKNNSKNEIILQKSTQIQEKIANSKNEQEEIRTQLAQMKQQFNKKRYEISNII